MDARLVGGKLLRRGYTTGSCAAAAAQAATRQLFSQSVCPSVTLRTPGGVVLTLNTTANSFSPDAAVAAVQKDSGDDPDITNGMFVYAAVRKIASGIEITGGAGVGRVTKPGLDQPVGASAINSVPRRAIRAECEAVAAEYGYTGGLAVEISIPGGEDVARRTFNPRLGIEGGLSILGTSGIVEPMSQAAIVDTIRAELSVLRESGCADVLFTVGNHATSFVTEQLRLGLVRQVKCANFIGASLTAAAELKFDRALLVGHVGKLVKLGIGLTNTHSDHADGRIETLLACALEAGSTLTTLRAIEACVSTDAALDRLEADGLLDAAMAVLKRRIDETIRRRTASHLAVGFVVFRGLGRQMTECARNELADTMMEVFLP